jgi:hypothetical protein
MLKQFLLLVTLAAERFCVITFIFSSQLLIMKFFAFWILFFHFYTSKAQGPFTEKLLLAETNFSLESQIYGLRYGFTKNLDTGAVGINKNGFARLLPIWESRPERGDGPVLIWEPKSVFTAENGLFGVTNGPYYTKSSEDSFLRNTGYFFSIWLRRDTTSPYRIILDAGIKLKNSQTPQRLTTHTIKKVWLKEITNLATQMEFTSALLLFREQVATHTLISVLKRYTFEQADFLVSGYGNLSLETLGDKVEFQKKFRLQSRFLPGIWPTTR